jgi:glycosyltransferase involved in cell wall biosynthesis
MISFIVIGRNEGEKLRRCFDSIYKTISSNSLNKYEIIYVDSKSTDNSIEMAKAYEEIKIFYLTETCNAAIARNVGANEATGDYFFFIDGDMEINKCFLCHVFDESKKNSYHLVTGQIVDVTDDYEDSKRINDKLQFLSSGVFIIRKELWNSVKGMKTKYMTGEDVNLGLRLIKKGFPVVHQPDVITRHFTIPYFHKSRIWKSLWDKSYFYSRCVLYRDLFWNRNMYAYLFLIDKTFILFIFLMIIGLLVPSYILPVVVIYFFAVIFRSVKQKKLMSVPEYVVFYAVSDILNLVYFFTFFPKAKPIKYIRVVK